MKVGKFLVAIWADWLARMSGPLTVPFTVAALFVSTAAYRELFAGLAVLAAMVTCYRVWVHEYDSADALKQQVEHRRPELMLNIESTLWIFDKERDITVFVLSAYLLNRGEPSVAMSWNARYQIGDVVEDMTGFYLHDDGYRITIGDQELTLTNENLLMPQVLTRRLERGEGKLGRIIFSIPGNRAEQIATNQFTITVGCFDFQGTPCSAAYKPSGVPLPAVMMFPGEKLVSLRTPVVGAAPR